MTEAETALAAGIVEATPKPVESRLLAIWPKVEPGAVQALEARMQERTKNLRKFLDDRSEREVSHLTVVMTELERSIREELKKEEDPQLKLDLSDAAETERAQRDRDLDNLRHRLAKIPAELAGETAHLRSRYENPQPRLFPLAVTFLVPRRAVAQLAQGGQQ